VPLGDRRFRSLVSGNKSPVATRGILYWTRAAALSSAAECRPGDIGRAWVIEADGTERDINGGDPITRAEAERLAEVGDYTFDAEG
jgi:hypothetical protein